MTTVRRGVDDMNFEFAVRGEIFEWRGPAPYHFVALTGETSSQIRERAAVVTYGWGMIPVTCRIGQTTFHTSLWPKGEDYYLPLKDAVRASEHLVLGSHVTVALGLRDVHRTRRS